MRKEDTAKTDSVKCPKCEYYNPNKKRCALSVCKNQLSLLDIIGNRF